MDEQQVEARKSMAALKKFERPTFARLRRVFQKTRKIPLVLIAGLLTTRVVPAVDLAGATQEVSPRVEPVTTAPAVPEKSATAAEISERTAQDVREQIVEFASIKFGPSLLHDWNYPNATWPTQRDTYVMAYVRLMQLELSAQKPGDVVPDAKASVTTASAAFRFLTRVLGGQMGPASDIISNVASATSGVGKSSSPPSSLYEAHLREVFAIAQEILSATDFQAYAHAADTGDYVTQTGLLFKINYEVLNRQPITNPYVLWWCDMRGPDGRVGSRPVIDFREIAPGDERFMQATWGNLTQPQRWIAVDDALKNWFQRTSTALMTSAERAAYFSSIKIQNDERRRGPALGTDVKQVNRELVAALGPEVLQRYEHADAAEQVTLLKTATVFTEGINSLLPMLMGNRDLRVDGTVSPLLEHL